MQLKLVSICASLLLAISGFSQDSSSVFKVMAYIDTYYGYDMNEPVGGNRQYSNMAGRHNEFNINHAYILGEYMGERIRGELGIQTGTYPNLNYAAEPSDLYKLIYKATVGVNVWKNIWLDAGVFPGHFGYGSVETIENEIYSRTLGSEYTPYYETGIKLSAEYDKIYWNFVVVNGWQTIAETNKTKAFGMDIGYKPFENLELNYGNYFGNEGSSEIGDKYRFHHSAFIKYEFGPKINATVTADVGTQEDWVTTESRMYYLLSAVSEYYFTEKLSIAGRIELVNDEYQILINTNIPGGLNGQIYALNVNYRITPNSMIRIEGKFYDMSDQVFNAGEFSSSTNTFIAASLAARFN